MATQDKWFRNARKSLAKTFKRHHVLESSTQRSIREQEEEKRRVAEEIGEYGTLRQRKPSGNVSKQETDNCWDYAITRAICRIICIHLEICGTQEIENMFTEGCNELFEMNKELHYGVFDADEAEEVCGGNDSIMFKKLMLFQFFL